MDPHPWVERGVGILEHHLQVPAGSAQRAHRRAEDSLARQVRSVPQSGFSTPTISLPSVVLPHPDSPTSPSVSPASTCSVTSETAFTESTSLEDRARGDRVLAHDVGDLEQAAVRPSTPRRRPTAARPETIPGQSLRPGRRPGASTRRDARGPRRSAAAPGPALLGRARAAGGEAAPGGRVVEVGRQAGDAEQRACGRPARGVGIEPSSACV